jgi:hypothetical protein
VCWRSALNRYGVLDNPPLRIVVVGQISAKELAQYLGVFTDEQTLPSGAAMFRASLFNEAGLGAQFLVTCAVLPSNPFDLDHGLFGHLGNVG